MRSCSSNKIKKQKHMIFMLLITALPLFLLCLIFTAKPVYADEAAVLNQTAQFTFSLGAAGSITDQNRSTKAQVNGTAELKIESSLPIASLYIIWDDLPSELAFELNGSAATINGGVFLHDYILLPSPASTVSLKVTSGTICDIYVLGEGDVPGFVQKWQASYDDADMLVFPTHADDEHLYFGGTMPFYSESKKVQVVYFTNHDGEKYRNHELLDGLYAVGIRAYPVISGFRDVYADTIEQARALYPEEEALKFTVSMLRRFQPEVVIMHDFNGEYGHGFHKYNAYIMSKALDTAADPEQFPMPEYAASHNVEKAYFHLYEENQIVMDWSVPLARFDGKTALEVAKLGYDAHKSQHRWSFAVEDFGKYDCRKFGLYRSTVGSDLSKNDFFENITDEMYSDYTPPPPPPKSESTPESVGAPQSTGSASSEADSGANGEDTGITAKTYFIAVGAPILLALLAIAISTLNKRNKR